MADLRSILMGDTRPPIFRDPVEDRIIRGRKTDPAPYSHDLWKFYMSRKHGIPFRQIQRSESEAVEDALRLLGRR